MAVDTGDKITRKYQQFRGVDLRGEECSINRSPDSLNMWRNYKKLASIETRPGLKLLHQADRINCMMWDKDKLFFIDDGGYLYSWSSKTGQNEEFKYGEETVENCEVGKNGILFSFGGKVYAMGEKAYVNVTDGKPVEPYIPTTSIARNPSGGGKMHEDANLLTNRRINTFLSDGASNSYYVDAPYITVGESCHIIVKIDDEEMMPNKDYIVEPQVGRIEFNLSYGAPKKPKTDGQDNVSIEFVYDPEHDFDKGVEVSQSKLEKVLKCTLAQEFDNRIFFSGNPDYPNMVRHCSLENPAYISDLDYYMDGSDSAPIRSMVAGNNGLWVFRDETPTNNSVFYHTPALDADYGKIYPSSHSSIAIGCVGRACNFNDDIVFFSRRGMEGASTDITTEQFVTHRSSLVDRMMMTNDKYKGMVLAEWEGYLFVFVGNDAYIADSRAVTTIENHVEYEWYRWNLGDVGEVTCASVHDGILYIATSKDSAGEIYSFTKDPKEGDETWNPTTGKRKTSINSYWTTPKDTFGAPNKLKTTNKKGCVVEAIGDVEVSVKTDDDDAYELIGTNEGIDDYFVSRIKRKKFKDLQLKFESKTSFSLEAVTIETFVGGYIKR